ncbi:antigen peptide transporter 2 isoform X1 [Strix uralensis]|uniref:antigen peptide transporter 2 isoform X1 n=1 Tax=Strix uralensis TaxID=36305 RepID=UPI003DA7783F
MALLPAVRLACLLLLVDLVVLAALARLAPALARLGPAAAWLEAALRLLALGAAARLLVPGGPRGAAVVLGLTPATFLTLRSLVVPDGAAPALLATASPLWLTLTHGAAAAALLLWAAPSPGGAAGVESTAAVWRLLALAWAEWPVLGGAFIFLALAVLGETAGPYCTGKALDAVRHGDGLTAATVGLVLAADLGSSLFAGCRGGLFVLAQARLKLSTRHRLFSRLVRQDLAFFQGTPAAELSARLANDVPLLCWAVPSSANVALRSLGLVLGLGGFMVGLSPRLALLALLEVPLGVTARKVYDVRHQALQRATLDATAKTAAVVQEAVASIETVRTFAGEEEEERRHSQAVAEMLRLKNQMDVEWTLFILIRRVLQLATQVLVLCHGHRQLREGTITAGSLVTFLLYQAKVGHYVQALVFGHGDLLSKAVAGRKILDYLDREPTGDVGGTHAPATLQGHVTFRCVSFAYPTRPEHLVLQDVSFELRPGEMTALAGLNGSGKSTCAGLLERFYEPGAGEVLLDGVPLRDYEHRYLHRQVALVGQEPVLFSGTIRDNITLGLEGCGEEEVRAAADAAGALGFISALDQGFDTAACAELGGPDGAADHPLPADAGGGRSHRDAGTWRRGGDGDPGRAAGPPWALQPPAAVLPWRGAARDPGDGLQGEAASSWPGSWAGGGGCSHQDEDLSEIKQNWFSEEPAGVINLLPPPREVAATVLHSPEAPALHPGASLPRVKDLCGGCSGQAGSTPPSRAHPYVVSLPRAPRAVTSSQRRSQPRTT